MTQFVYHKAGNSEAQQKIAFAFMLAQDSTGIATDGVLNGLGVSQTTTASASVVVGKGAAVAQDTLLAGAGLPVLDTDLTLDVLGANPMGGVPRNDLVVFDTATISSGAGGVRVIVGTPNAVPTDPSVPATAVALARLRHAASATTVPAAKIDDLRAFTRVGGGPFAMCAGRYAHSSTISAGSSVGPFAQTFPAGRFTVAPNVTFGIIEGSRLVAYATSVTSTGFNLYLRNVSASDSPGGVDIATWHALQMTPVSADG